MVPQFVGHEVHIGGYVLKELAVAGAEVVEAGIPVKVTYKAVFRALSVTSKEEAAFPALLWKQAAFYLGKLTLPGRIHHLSDGFFMQIAEQVFGIYKVVA